MSDLNNCKRDYEGFTCIRKFASYGVNQIQSKCYITSNESYFPEINHTQDLVVDVYLAGTNLTENDLKNEITKVNSVWNRYGVNLTINNIDTSRSKENIDLKCRWLGFECRKGLREVIYNKINNYYNLSHFEKNKNMILVIAPYGKGDKGIQISDLGLLVSTNAKNRTWVIIHELAHPLGLYDKAFYSGEVNLMTHSSCISDELYPTNLNEKQVKVVINKVKEIKEAQNIMRS
jgi:hypothetical protein